MRDYFEEKVCGPVTQRTEQVRALKSRAQSMLSRVSKHIRDLGTTGGSGDAPRSRFHGWAQQLGFRGAVSPALLIVGALLLGYVGAQYGQMYVEQHRLEREWQQQQRAHRSAGTANAKDVKAADPDDGLTRLSAPKIDLDSVVVEGTSHHALMLGPGHLEDTPAPGEPGNSVISGHRDTFFRHIHELEKGDTVLVQRDGKTYRYEVVGKKIVEPDDVSVIRPVKDSQLTLITCYPTYYIGPAPKRLVVFTKLIGEQPEMAAAQPADNTGTRHENKADAKAAGAGH